MKNHSNSNTSMTPSSGGFRGERKGHFTWLLDNGLGIDHRRKSYLKLPDGSLFYEKQEQFDRRYLEMADIWAKNSYCLRRKVGALIVKDKMIISDGYNGTPSGFENICEDDSGKTKPYVLHAEANAITKVAKSNNSSDNATLYVTTSPCMECAKLIIQSGIKRVVYCNQYRKNDGLELLRKANIEIIFFENIISG